MWVNIGVSLLYIAKPVRACYLEEHTENRHQYDEADVVGLTQHVDRASLVSCVETKICHAIIQWNCSVPL